MIGTVRTENLTKQFFIFQEEKSSFGLRLRRLFRKPRKVTTAVDAINIQIEKGELFGLLGPNGAGKTTTIKMLCTLLEPTAGTAYVSGFNIQKESMKVRESIGVLTMGERSIYWKLSGRENLEYFATLYRIPPRQRVARVKEVLKFLQLSDRADDLVERYSSGMKQKIALGKCLLNDAPILFLDEPTLGLDPAFAREVRSLILGLRDQGKTILLTTHYMEEADQMCDRIAIIQLGKIIALDKPATLKKIIKDEEIIEIEGRNIHPHVSEEIKKMEAVTNLISEISTEGTGNLRIHAQIGSEIISQLTSIIESQGGKVLSLKMVEPTLEDVFLHYTGARLKPGPA